MLHWVRGLQWLCRSGLRAVTCKQHFKDITCQGQLGIVRLAALPSKLSWPNDFSLL